MTERSLCARNVNWAMDHKRKSPVTNVTSGIE